MSVRRETRERGTGITARKAESVEITGRMGVQEREALADIFRGPFDFEGLYGERLEAECRKRLLHAGIEKTRTVQGKPIPARNWREALADRGAGEDTPQGYAGRILDSLESARQFARSAEAKNPSFLESAMRYVFELGAVAMQADLKAAHEANALIGRGVIAGGKKGHEIVFGPEAERRKSESDIAAEFWKEVNANKRDHGKDMKIAARDTVAKRRGISASTVERAVRKRFVSPPADG